MQSHQTTIHQNHPKNDWYFIPTVLFSTAGIAIGMTIGSMLGWM